MSATTLIIFGATGDLAKQKLFPTLYNLSAHGRSPDQLTLVAVGRRPFTRESFIAQLKEAMLKKIRIQDEAWDAFASKLFYYQMDLEQDSAYGELATFLTELEQEQGGCNRLFYLSVPPQTYSQVLHAMNRSGLHHQSEGKWRRIVVEKPFGYDLASAQQLNAEINQLFSDDQVYRIDHYLAKETVQNILAFRFSNGIFEPLWNKQNIDHVQITVAEEGGVEGRAGYYDRSGAFRDIVQNHILQLLAILTMEEPVEFSYAALSNEKAKILQLLKFDKERTLFGQYEGYLDDPSVIPGSKTETYAMTTLAIHSNRWEGVPFYLRTGKKLAKRVSEISIQFKGTHQHLFDHTDEAKSSNVLTFRLQPDEGLSLRLAVKTPRQNMQVQPVQMEFCYGSTFRMELPDAYERLFYDVLVGDKSLTLREDVIEKSWELIDEILAYKSAVPLLTYPPGSWGPSEADEILTKDGRYWLAHESTVCNGIMIENVE